MYYKVLLMSAALLITNVLSAEQIAVDLGTGQVKFFVGNIKDGKPHEIAQNVLKVPLGESLVKSGSSKTISDEAATETIKSINTLKSKSLEIANSKDAVIQGLATAVFRQAVNGEKTLKRIIEETGIPFQVLSEEEESAIGFHSVFAFTQDKYLPQQTMVFESGSGSMQLGFLNEKGSFQSFSLPFGTTHIVALFRETFSREKINPVTADEIDGFIKTVKGKIEDIRKKDSKAQQFFSGLSQKLKTSPNVVGIGFGGLVGAAMDTWQMTRADFYIAIQSLANKSDTAQEITALKGLYPDRVVPSLIMLYAVMEALQVETISWENIPAGGGAFAHLFLKQ